jgi:integrase
MKLTDRAVSRLTAPDPSAKQKLIWDSELTGFGVLVSGTTSAKTYVVQRAINGKTRRVTVAPTNVLDLTAARQRAEEVLAEFYRGNDPKLRRVTLRQALESYLMARKTLSPKTVKDLRANVERNLEPWADLPLRDISADTVEARHRSLQTEVAKRGRYSGKASANNSMRSLGTLWSFAGERDAALPPNPVTRLRRQWFPVHRRERIVKADDLSRFYQAVMSLENPVQRDYLLLLLFTGLRRTEAATLTWDDVDFAQRLIRIPAGRTKAGRKLDLPMSDLVRDMLVARRAIGDARFVFPSDGRGSHIAEPKFPLQRVAKATGIRVSAHDLRRTFITVAESADISPLALKALVNHSTGSDVTSGYVIVTTERLRAPAQRVADELKKLCNIKGLPGVARLQKDNKKKT